MGVSHTYGASSSPISPPPPVLRRTPEWKTGVGKAGKRNPGTRGHLELRMSHRTAMGWELRIAPYDTAQNNLERKKLTTPPLVNATIHRALSGHAFTCQIYFRHCIRNCSADSPPLGGMEGLTSRAGARVGGHLSDVEPARVAT